MKKKKSFRKWTGEFGWIRLLLGRKMIKKNSLNANNTFSTPPGHRVAVEVFQGLTDTVDNDTRLDTSSLS